MIIVKLKKILKQNDMTQSELADITGLSPTQISRICNDKAGSLNKEHLCKIAKALKLSSVNELLEFDQEVEE